VFGWPAAADRKQLAIAGFDAAGDGHNRLK
jgi:hypothetical protein